MFKASYIPVSIKTASRISCVNFSFLHFVLLYFMSFLHIKAEGMVYFITNKYFKSENYVFEIYKTDGDMYNCFIGWL